MKTVQTKQRNVERSHWYSSRRLDVHQSSVMTTTQSVTGLRRMLYLLLAGGFFVLAMAGVILPGLPTTPFLLLTSYFLVRSYPRLNERLIKSKLFGPILVDWHVKGEGDFFCLSCDWPFCVRHAIFSRSVADCLCRCRHWHRGDRKTARAT